MSIEQEKAGFSLGAFEEQHAEQEKEERPEQQKTPKKKLFRWMNEQEPFTVKDFEQIMREKGEYELFSIQGIHKAPMMIRCLADVFIGVAGLALLVTCIWEAYPPGSPCPWPSEHS